MFERPSERPSIQKFGWDSLRVAERVRHFLGLNSDIFILHLNHTIQQAVIKRKKIERNMSRDSH